MRIIAMDSEKSLTPMSFTDIKSYLREKNDEKDDFIPIRFFHALVTNKKYDPNGFDENIENSEPDYVREALKVGPTALIKLMFSGSTAYENSKEWIENHSKKANYNISVIGLFQSCVHSDGTRDYCSEKNIRLFEEWFNELKSKDIEVFKIS